MHAHRTHGEELSPGAAFLLLRGLIGEAIIGSTRAHFTQTSVEAAIDWLKYTTQREARSRRQPSLSEGCPESSRDFLTCSAGFVTNGREVQIGLLAFPES